MSHVQAELPRGCNIVLTGFMGTGKTTVGRIVAERLSFTFVDTDELIERRHGPIPDIFERGGEAAFRTIERHVAAELSNKTGLVVSTGGRLMLDPRNRTVLGPTAHVFCLAASPDDILTRVLSDNSGMERPLLAGNSPAGTIRRLLDDRAEGYGVFPQIDTTGRSPEEIADEIVATLGVAQKWTSPGSKAHE